MVNLPKSYKAIETVKGYIIAKKTSGLFYIFDQTGGHKQRRLFYFIGARQGAYSKH